MVGLDCEIPIFLDLRIRNSRKNRPSSLNRIPSRSGFLQKKNRLNRSPKVNISGWWLSPTPLKNMLVSLDDNSQYYGKSKMCETTNQLLYDYQGKYTSTVCKYLPKSIWRFNY